MMQRYDPVVSDPNGCDGPMVESRSSISTEPTPSAVSSMDDPDVRIAIEALNGLKAAEEPLQFTPPPQSAFISSAKWAYENSKSYSSSFRYGAEKLERYAASKSATGHSTVRRPSQGSLTSVLVGAGVALSEESLKSLRYCLKWLLYANNRLGRSVESLKSLLNEGHIHPAWSARVASIREEVVSTLRKVVTVLSTYAGSALPEPARTRVKGYMLSLPGRWTAKNPQKMSTADPLANEREKAGRVLVLASEGLDMLQNITMSVGETLESAENWCDTFGRRKHSAVSGEGFYNGALDEKDDVMTMETAMPDIAFYDDMKMNGEHGGNGFPPGIHANG